ncbi:MAG: protein kinase [Kofleriaceae bacterium]
MFVCTECGHRDGGAGACPDDGTPLARTDDPLLGIELGRYRLARTIGEGGRGRVYLGVQRAIGSRVAIKVLSEQCSKDAELVERFFAEARAVNLIRHEHIVAVIDMDLLPNGRPYIVMEYIAGPTLAHLVRGRHPPLGGVVEVVGEILSALAAAHAIGIVHRDLKPDNVLITAEGHAKVLDFGIAKLAPGLQGSNSPRTATGALLGTPAYMAPEQIKGAAIDARTDVYAAGILLYECMTGRPPFAGETLYDLMRAHLEQPAPVARALRPEIPVALEHILVIALAKDPAKRFASAGAMATALEAASLAIPDPEWRSLASTAGLSRRRNLSDAPQLTPRSIHVAATLPASPTSTPAAPARPRLAIGIGLLALIAAIIAIALTAMRDPPPAVVPPQVGVVASPDAAIPDALPAPTPQAPVMPHSPATVDAKPRSDGRPSARVDAATGGETIQIGPNVSIGGNTKIGQDATTLPGTRIEVHVDDPSFPGNGHIESKSDYPPTAFDPSAWLATARVRARAIMPDAELTELHAFNVRPDGRVDLTRGTARYFTTYTFRSPARSKQPTDVTPGTKVDQRCRVIVEARRDAVIAFVVTAGGCTQKIIGTPRCTLVEIWRRATGVGVPSSTVGHLQTHEGKWWFVDAKDVTYESKDDC